MSKFQVSANGQDVGVYEGETSEDALNAYAIDAGYKNYDDVVAQFGDDAEAIQLNEAEDFASDEALWIEYIDPDNTTPFDSVSYEDRVSFARSVISSNK